tara:strand:- start:1711 stop:2451 length:741 start_codon:yes stop_codon:yes gene_type:complete
MEELNRFRQYLAEGVIKEAYNLPDLDSNTSKYVNNHWDGILKDILRAHTDLRNSKGGESIPERPSQIDIDAVLDKFSDADDYIDVDPNVYDEDYFDFYDMYIVTQRRDESTKNISDEDYPKGNYDGYTKRDDLDKLSDLAEGKLYEAINLDIEDDIAILSGDSGEYEGEIEDGKASFSIMYDDLDYRITDQYNEDNIEDFLGKGHAFVELAKKYGHNWDIERDLVGITVELPDLAEGVIKENEEQR